MNHGVPPEDMSLIVNEIAGHLGASKNVQIYLYGSRAKGTFRPYSDIDILVKAEIYDESSLDQIDFSDLDTPYKIDFVLWKDLFEGYRSEVESHMIRLA